MESAQNPTYAAAIAAFRARKFPEARFLCKKAMLAGDVPFDVQLIDAILEMRLGDRGVAVERMEQLRKAEPDSIEVVNWLAVAYAGLRRYDQVHELAEELIRRAPDRVYGYAHLGDYQMSIGELDKAIVSFRKAISMSPELPDLHNSLGAALFRSQKFPEAEIALRRVIELSPKNSMAYKQLADVLVLQYKEEEAALVLRKSAEVNAGSEEAPLRLVHALHMERKPEEAIEVLRAEIAKKPDVGVWHAQLAMTLQQFGSFGEAMQECEIAMRLSPEDPAPVYTFPFCKTVTESELPLLDRLREFADRPNLRETDRVQIQYALGKSMNDLRDYKRAMEHFDAANKLLLRRWSTYDHLRDELFLKESKKMFSSTFIRSVSAHGAPEDQPIFIVGMIRSGTTLTEQIISSHSDVGSLGETNYWLKYGSQRVAMERRLPGKDAVQKLRRDFQKLSATVYGGATRVTEKTPMNFSVLGLIYLCFPNAKIIHCRRSALDTCISIYSTPFRHGIPFGHDKGRIVRFYESYLGFMEHWRTVLPEKTLLEIDYEELVADREPIVRRMLDFCGLSWDEACLHPEDNDRTVSTPSMWQVRQPVYKTSVEKWRRYEPWLGEFQRLAQKPTQPTEA